MLAIMRTRNWPSELVAAVWIFGIVLAIAGVVLGFMWNADIMLNIIAGLIIIFCTGLILLVAWVFINEAITNRRKTKIKKGEIL